MLLPLTILVQSIKAIWPFIKDTVFGKETIGQLWKKDRTKVIAILLGFVGLPAVLYTASHHAFTLTMRINTLEAKQHHTARRCYNKPVDCYEVVMDTFFMDPAEFQKGLERVSEKDQSTGKPSSNGSSNGSNGDTVKPAPETNQEPEKPQEPTTAPKPVIARGREPEAPDYSDIAQPELTPKTEPEEPPVKPKPQPKPKPNKAKPQENNTDLNRLYQQLR